MATDDDRHQRERGPDGAAQGKNWLRSPDKDELRDKAAERATLFLAACDESDRERTVLETSNDGPAPGATAPGDKPPDTESVIDTSTATADETTTSTSESDLATVGATGTVGPDLDDAEPSYEDTLEQITNGGGGMPPFDDQLSEREIRNVAAFVAEATKA